MLTLEQLNAASAADFVALLDGTYEHSPWVAEAAAAARPFATLAALKLALVAAVRNAGVAAQERLIRAHPELAGKAMISRSLTAESDQEQTSAGLADCTPEEYARIQQLNAEYNARFGWPFILAVRGPNAARDGAGLSRADIINTFERRLAGPPDFERAEALRNIHRIAEIRLNDKLGFVSTRGQQVWDWAEQLAQHSDPEYKARGELTVTYLTDAHQAVAAQLQRWMHACGFDSVTLDAVGNVVGVYEGTNEGTYEGKDATVPRLLTGSHYDTVRNGGKYDGRLGILVPMVLVQALAAQGRRLPFGIEVVGFAEEEGQRYKATFLGSGALTGHFDPAWLEQRDANGIRMVDAMRTAGLTAGSTACLPASLTADMSGMSDLGGMSSMSDMSDMSAMSAITALRRDPARYLGFVEVHIEQGPVLNGLDLPLGVVTSINGSLRYVGEVTGQASHAGTTPMDRRRDAACAAAELVLAVEQRAAAVPDVVGTVGLLQVPAGSINVVPGRCSFSLDLRATTNAARDALGADVRAALAAITARRGLQYTLEPTLVAHAAPSDAAWQQRWERAVAALGLPVHRMPSGAGHDAMKLHEVMPQAMLFVRGGNSGISHNPLETVTADDAELCVAAFMHLLEGLAAE
ncbi:MAG: 2-oxo-4-hydroxy-4-carboxy-5-ureidoimidazoline decarboxylase [Rubrivivax sp.]|nr:2-oxo-4-hydroxy-4-carboxy-5-ureidoimidazoline decarboxylase [Rubrivivax sp.]